MLYFMVSNVTRFLLYLVCCMKVCLITWDGIVHFPEGRLQKEGSEQQTGAFCSVVPWAKWHRINMSNSSVLIQTLLFIVLSRNVHQAYFTAKLKSFIFSCITCSPFVYGLSVFSILTSIHASTDPISTGGSLNFHLILNQKAKKGRQGGQTAEMRAGGGCQKC